MRTILFWIILGPLYGGWRWGAVAQSVGHATRGEEVLGSISTVAARPLMVG